MYEDEAPHVEAGLLKEAEHRGIPILGVCYGIQELVRLDASVASSPQEA